MGTTRWVVHGASGGCVTVVALIRELQARKHTTLAFISDCGIPGSGEPIPVPISVFRSRKDPYWNRHGAHLVSIWKQQGYQVEFDSDSNEIHAWVVDEGCIKACVQWVEHRYGVCILE